MAAPLRTPPPPREGIVDLDERRRLAAEAEAREREAGLRADPSVGPVGEPPRSTRDPITSDRPVRSNDEALAQARGDYGRTNVDRGRPGDRYDPARDPANAEAARERRLQERTPLHEPLPPTGPDNRADIRYAERESARGRDDDRRGYGSSPGYGETRDPDQLQDEIELLQNRMQQRLEGITSAFEPQNLIAAATGTKNPDVFTTIDTVVDAARRNPVPASLIAAGLAGLFLNGRYGQRPVRQAEAYEALPPGVEGMDRDGRRVAASGVAEPSTADRAEEQVRALQDATAARLEAATIAARETYDTTRQRVASGTSYVADTGRDAWAWVKENPTAIGLAALAAGALAAGYYTASPPKRRPIPRDRALTVRDDYRDDYRNEYAERSYRDERLRAESATMPVSAAAPAPMPPSMGVGTGMETANAGGAIGGSGQIETEGAPRSTVPATPRGGVQPVGGLATETSRDRTTAGPTGSGGSSGSSGSSGLGGAAATGAALSGAALLGDVATRSDSSTSSGSTSGASAGGEAARDASRTPSGAGFGSTAASRGEVESKPSDGKPSGGSASGGRATSDAPATVGSTGTGTGRGTAAHTADSGSVTGRTETSSTLVTPKDEDERRTDDASSSTVELTSVYPRS